MITPALDGGSKKLDDLADNVENPPVIADDSKHPGPSLFRRIRERFRYCISFTITYIVICFRLHYNCHLALVYKAAVSDSLVVCLFLIQHKC